MIRQRCGGAAVRAAAAEVAVFSFILAVIATVVVGIVSKELC